MTTEERIERIERLTANTAASVAAHNDRIGKLIQAAEINRQEWEQLWREFRAYLSTIPPRQ
jgi:hypothetical protein